MLMKANNFGNRGSAVKEPRLVQDLSPEETTAAVAQKLTLQRLFENMELLVQLRILLPLRTNLSYRM